MENDPFAEIELPVETGDADEMPETVETAATSLAILVERVDQLAQWCERLVADNRVLRERVSVLQTERDALREKNEQSRARIDAMVVRLKGLGQSS